jgi:hypothetical protein
MCVTGTSRWLSSGTAAEAAVAAAARAVVPVIKKSLRVIIFSLKLQPKALMRVTLKLE